MRNCLVVFVFCSRAHRPHLRATTACHLSRHRPPRAISPSQTPERNHRQPDPSHRHPRTNYLRGCGERLEGAPVHVICVMSPDAIVYGRLDCEVAWSCCVCSFRWWCGLGGVSGCGFAAPWRCSAGEEPDCCVSCVAFRARGGHRSCAGHRQFEAGGRQVAGRAQATGRSQVARMWQAGRNSRAGGRQVATRAQLEAVRNSRARQVADK